MGREGIRSRIESLGLVRPFHLEPDLVAHLPVSLRLTAQRNGIVEGFRVGRGEFEGSLPLAGPEHLGLCILAGLMVRRVHLMGRAGAELLGPGDVICPAFEIEPFYASLETRVVIRVLEPVDLAVLDRDFERLAARLPGVLPRLMGRATSRASRLGLQLAIVHSRSLELRLLCLLWELSDRWGRRSPGGVVLRLPLTQSTLADLTCSRRPSVNEALAHLAERGLIARDEGGWRLHGDPPRESMTQSVLALA